MEQKQILNGLNFLSFPRMESRFLSVVWFADRSDIYVWNDSIVFLIKQVTVFQ